MSWIGMVIQAGGKNLQGIASYRQGQYIKQVGEANAQQKRNEADSLIAKSAFDIARHREDVKKFKGRQKVAFLKSGVEQSGSVIEVLADTDIQANLDEDIIRYNAEAGASTLRYEANVYAAGARQAYEGGKAAFYTSLLGSASVGADYGTAQYNRRGK